MTDEPYPGANANPLELVALATEYHDAAIALLERGRKGQPPSRAPARLCAIHAIELYLSAFLLNANKTPEEIRALGHDLAARAVAVRGCGLVLKKRTSEHLARMTETREYLISRYGPEMKIKLSELNRLMATLDEVSGKVESRVTGVSTLT